jgi:hypothetical protein
MRLSEIKLEDERVLKQKTLKLRAYILEKYYTDPPMISVLLSIRAHNMC